jgi:hypothetical protein
MNLDKLPKWAREHIEDLQRQRDLAVNSLNSYLDSKTPSPFYHEQLSCLNGKGAVVTRNYVNGAGRMTVEWGGVCVRIELPRDDAIEISYEPCERMMGDVLLTPISFQRLSLKKVNNEPR